MWRELADRERRSNEMACSWLLYTQSAPPPWRCTVLEMDWKPWRRRWCACAHSKSDRAPPMCNLYTARNCAWLSGGTTTRIGSIGLVEESIEGQLRDLLRWSGVNCMRRGNAHARSIYEFPTFDAETVCAHVVNFGAHALTRTPVCIMYYICVHRTCIVVAR